MAKKKLVKPASKQTQQRNQTEKTIQYVAGAIVVLVIGFFAWRFIPTSATVSGSSACELFDSIPVAEQYEAPPQLINTAGKYFATVEMEKGGTFKIELLAEKAPITVNSFVFLSCKGFYDGITFHRVLEGFMAQGGDPDGTGAGGPGYEFVNEDSDLVFDKEGVVAMANAGRDTNGSQFFITFAPADFLNGGYTIFGQVIEGMDVVNAIKLRDPDQNPDFTGDVIKTIVITEE